MTLNGGSNLITSGVTVTEITPTTYSIGGLGSLTTADGNYDLTVSAGGLVDGSGNSGVGFLSETWTMNTVGPTVASLPTYIQSPRNIVVPTIDVIFSEPIVPQHVHVPEHHVFQARRAEPDHAQCHDHAALADRVRDFQLQQPAASHRRDLHVHDQRGRRRGPVRQHGNRQRFGYLDADHDGAHGPDGPGDLAEHRRLRRA